MKKNHKTMSSIFRVPTEIESTLIIWSENPEAVAREIAGLPLIANYRLLPKSSETIHDVYFDTPKCELQAEKFALRIRKIGAMRWITLKGPSQPIDWGSMKRLEIEELWSKNALARVLQERQVKKLMGRRIRMLRQLQDFNRVEPWRIMESLELEVIQDRETRRKVKNIVFRGEENGPVLAELAIDSVVYRFNNREIRHHEVEIESKMPGGSTIVKTSKSLVEMYEQKLRGWSHSKLATGRAIEKLLGERALEGLLDINNNLKPAAYDKIDDCLKHSNI